MEAAHWGSFGFGGGCVVVYIAVRGALSGEITNWGGIRVKLLFLSFYRVRGWFGWGYTSRFFQRPNLNQMIKMMPLAMLAIALPHHTLTTPKPAKWMRA